MPHELRADDASENDNDEKSRKNDIFSSSRAVTCGRFLFTSVRIATRTQPRASYTDLLSDKYWFRSCSGGGGRGLKNYAKRFVVTFASILPVYLHSWFSKSSRLLSFPETSSSVVRHFFLIDLCAELTVVISRRPRCAAHHRYKHRRTISYRDDLTTASARTCATIIIVVKMTIGSCVIKRYYAITDMWGFNGSSSSSPSWKRVTTCLQPGPS